MVDEDCFECMSYPGVHHWRAYGRALHRDPDSVSFVIGENPVQGKPTVPLHVCQLVVVPDERGQYSESGDKPTAHFGRFAWSPDGTRLWGLAHDNARLLGWSGDPLRQVSLWDDSGLLKMVSGKSEIHSLAASDRWVVCGGRNGQLFVLPAADGKLQPSAVQPATGGSVRALAMAPGGEWLVAGNEGGAVEFRRLPSAVRFAELPKFPVGVESLALAREGTLLAVALDSGLLKLYQLDKDFASTGAPPTEWLTLDPRLGPLSTVRMSEDGTWVIAHSRRAHGVRAYNLATLREAFLTRGVGARNPPERSSSEVRR